MNKKIFTIPMECFFLLCALSFSAGALVFYASDDFFAAHIFLFFDLALAAAYTGFLLTALPAWLGYFKDLRRACLAFLALFCTMALAAIFDLNIARALACLYWLALSFFALFMSVQTRVYNHLIPMLFAFSAGKIYYAFSDNVAILHALVHLNTAFVLMINFRISMAICSSAVPPNCQFVANIYYKNLSVFSILLVVFASLFDINSQFLLLACAFMIFARLKDFHYFSLLKTHYIACFYGAFALLGASYLLYAFTDKALHLVLFSAVILHIILIFNIASLRHHGLDLVFAKRTFLSIFLILLSACARFFELFDISICSLSAAFLLQFFLLFKIFNHNRFLSDA